MFDQLFEPTLLMTYFFTVLRTGGILFTSPVFGSTMIKPQIRFAIAILFAAVMYRFAPPVSYGFDVPPLFLILQILRELLIGISIGTLTSTLFSAVQLGGYLIDFQMGFSMVNVMDPESGGSFSYISQVQNVLTILIFVAVGGPRLVMEAIAYSYQVIPLGTLSFSVSAFKFGVELFSKVFIIAVCITAPPVIALMAANAILGVMARIIPQINLLVVGFPLKIAVGLFVFMMSLRFFYVAFEKVMLGYFKNIQEMMRLFAN
jgi:flagellar biosynthetic protein FliR